MDLESSLLPGVPYCLQENYAEKLDRISHISSLHPVIFHILVSILLTRGTEEHQYWVLFKGKLPQNQDQIKGPEVRHHPLSNSGQLGSSDESIQGTNNFTCKYAESI